MRVIEPIRFEHRTKRRTKKRSRHLVRLVVILLVAVVVAVFGALRFLSPDLIIKPVDKQINFAAKDIALKWPSYGQAAVGARGYKVLAAHGEDTPLPTASIAKVMTAFAVLRQYPLALGEQGPMITMKTSDVQLYNDYLAKDGSTVAVQAGEQISEYQALQAILLPSANNMADTMAIWAFGSVEAYVDYANGLAKTIGLEKSHFADASGFSSDTVSTARDLVLLGESILLNDVMAEIISQTTADIPVAGTIKNVNFALGVEGINGIKTGNTEEAGGCFLVSASHTFADGQKIVVVAAVLGAPNLYTALQDSLPLLRSMYPGFGYVEFAKAGQEVANYSVPWVGNVPAKVTKDQKIFTWLGSEIKVDIQLRNIQAPLAKDTAIGTVSVGSGIFESSTDVVLTRAVPAPSASWRLKNILKF